MAVAAATGVLNFFRGIEFKLIKRPRGPREVATRAGVLAAIVVAAAIPFFISSDGQDVSEVAGQGFLAQLDELAQARTDLAALRDSASADAAAIAAVESRIEELEELTFLGYLKRDGDASKEGALVPDFRLLDLNGEPVQLSALGKPAIVNFWASWCGFCIEEMPDLQRLHEQVGDQITIVGINRGESQGTAARFAADTGARYTVVLDLDDELARRGGPYQVIGMPTTFYVRTDGIVDHVEVGFQTLERMGELAGALISEDVALEIEQVDTSYEGNALDLLASQRANHAVARELFARFEADPATAEQIAWQRNVVAQARIWITNQQTLGGMTPPDDFEALHASVADAFLLLETASALLQAAVDAGDLDQIRRGIALFNDASLVFDEASDDLRGVLETR